MPSRPVRGSSVDAWATAVTTLRQTRRPLLVGERLNAQGSRRVKRLLLAGNYDGLLDVAREQIAAGAHVLDVCVAMPECRDEADQMARLVSLLSASVELPLMIDSTDPAVIQAGLEHLRGPRIINSVDLASGRTRIDTVAPLARRHGAPLVALCIDEAGMAVTRERKLQVAHRMFEILTNDHGFQPDGIIYDALAFTLATGDPARAESAAETIEGIRLLERDLPGISTILGISNVSFGLAPPARAVLNAVFLHHCVQAGLDAAIVNPADVRPYAEIPVDPRELADDLVFNRRADALARFIAHFERHAAAEGSRVLGTAHT